MPLRKELVNDVLKQIATILQSYRPNVDELELIQAKIDSMVERNRSLVMKRGESSQRYKKSEKKPEKWYKIPVED
ncbi:MAG: hypothetical protein ACW967_08325 [Candidatus Hodarchaeales archaeon]